MVQKWGKGGSIIVVASALFVLSLFLPWVKIEFFFTQSENGFQQEGWLFLILFAYPLYTALTNKAIHLIAGLVSSVGALAFMLYFMFSGEELFGEKITRADFAGFGLYLALISMIVLVVGVYLKSKED